GCGAAEVPDLLEETGGCAGGFRRSVLQRGSEGLRPHPEHFLAPVGVARVYCHDDEIRDEQRHEPQGRSLSNLFLCANRSHAVNLKNKLATDYTDYKLTATSRWSLCFPTSRA